ncbi:MAG: hypothetical protein Q8P29_02285 [Candidatus Levybacteria bacterium]|nr:hypothetical protein [Candidatus Levybacteria bacterium]
MKNLCSKAVKKILHLKKNLIIIGFECLNSLKKDFSFHNNHTELLAIWTALFITIAGLFVFAIKSNIFVMFLLLIFAIAIMFAGTIATTYYLFALKYHNSKRMLPKIHNFLNRSFKLRTLLRFIKIPQLSFLGNFAKNLKLAS